MSILIRRLTVLLLFARFCAPAFADDCTTAKKAMLTSGLTPHSVTVTKTDAQGKTSVSRAIQTVDNKYVQLADGGKWLSLGIAMKDLSKDEFASAKFSCQSIGSDTVNGVSAVIYQVRIDDQGDVLNDKFWVSSNGLVLKSESRPAGTTGNSVVVYDYSHFAAPAQSTPMGGK